MNTKTKKWAGLAALLLGMMAFVTPKAGAVATSSATLDIEVNVIANLSVKVNTIASSTDSSVNWNTGNANQFFADASSATVTNDSGAQTEKWGLSTLANTIDQGTAGSWSLAPGVNSVGADQFAVQAVFGSAAKDGCPTTTADDWNNTWAPALTAGAPVTYTSTVFADTTLVSGGAGSDLPDVSTGGGNGRMLAGSSRSLCWRARMPSSTSVIDKQTIMVIVSALNP